MLRFHTQTGGATLTAQQPREQHRADGARGARGGARRDAVAAHELVRRGARAADRARREDRAADPAGDRARDRRDATPSTRSAARTTWRRSPTRSRRARVAYLDKIDGMGGAVAAIEAGFYQDEIHEAAFRIQQGIESGRARRRRREPVRGCRGAPARAPARSARRRSRGRSSGFGTLRAERDAGGRRAALADVEAAARGTENLLPPMKEALRARATLGEVSDVLRDVFGEYRPAPRRPTGRARGWRARRRDAGDGEQDAEPSRQCRAPTALAHAGRARRRLDADERLAHARKGVTHRAAHAVTARLPRDGRRDHRRDGRGGVRPRASPRARRAPGHDRLPRSQSRAPRRAAEAARSLGGDADVAGTTNDAAAAGAEVVFVTVPVRGTGGDLPRDQGRTCAAGTIVVRLHEPARDGRRRASLARGPALARLGGRAGGGDPRDRRPDGRGRSTRSRPMPCGRSTSPMDSDVLVCGDDAEAKAVVGGLIERHPGHALGRLRRALAGADRRDDDRAADLDQPSVQGPRQRLPDHRPRRLGPSGA